MRESFAFDVFLSHSLRDREVVRALAERLRADGVELEKQTFGFRDPSNAERPLEALRLDDWPIRGGAWRCAVGGAERAGEHAFLLFT